MCGIVGIFNIIEPVAQTRSKALKMATKIRHRGPDWSGIYSDDQAILAHERLSIVDVEHGAQPLIDKLNGNVLAVNGEIYNHMSLRDKLKKEHLWQTKSDCEIILYLYDEYGSDFMNMLNGMFAFILYDKKNGRYFIGRDHIGIIPLYVGWDEKGTFYVASEMKALNDYCTDIQEFPPGNYILGTGKSKDFVRWYKPEWAEKIPKKALSLPDLRQALEKSVKGEMMSDVPYGVLISGGLDSSLIAAIASKYRKKRVESGDQEEAWWPRLHSFAVGLEDSPDLKYARKVADYIGTVHHEIIFTIQEAFDAIRDVIYHLETFDVTTIRAATPMYLMARKIKSWASKWYYPGRELTKSSVATCTSTKHLTIKNSMKKPYENSSCSASTTACAQTKLQPLGVLKREYRFWTRTFWILQWGLTQARRCVQATRSRSTFCEKHSKVTSPKRFFGAKKNSSLVV
jgi:asparagine synthase (glutamine-hydrolysing)